MSIDPIQTAVAEALRQIAPDIEINEIDPGADLRDEFDIDSMDFLNLVTALGKRFDHPMPEADYDRMRTFDALVAYLRDQTAQKP